MKRTIKFLLKKLGYKLVSIDNKTYHDLQFQSLIVEHENVYRERILKDLPSHNKERICLLAQCLGTSVGEALYIIDRLNQTIDLEGDICEFGVAQGATSALMANEIKNTNKNIWLFDSFQGLPEPSKKDELKDDIFNLGSIKAYAGTMKCPMDMVKQRLNDIHFPFERAKIVEGFIEETIHLKHLPSKVSFAYVDVDFYQPIKIALNFLHDCLEAGGFIIIDDYDFFSTGAKTAVDEFMTKYSEYYSFELPVKAAGCFCILKKTRLSNK